MIISAWEIYKIGKESHLERLKIMNEERPFKEFHNWQKREINFVHKQGVLKAPFYVLGALSTIDMKAVSFGNPSRVKYFEDYCRWKENF